MVKHNGIQSNGIVLVNGNFPWKIIDDGFLVEFLTDDQFWDKYPETGSFMIYRARILALMLKEKPISKRRLTTYGKRYVECGFTGDLKKNQIVVFKMWGKYPYARLIKTQQFLSATEIW